MGTSGADKRLEKAWERAQQLPDFRKLELIDFIDFLMYQDEEDEVLGLSEEDIQAVEAVLSGEEKADIPWEQVKRESRELGDRVLD
ncbi:MAG: hypothetical protein U9R79_07060 [Armatimonadota bacterium]|nr:hypothetical protein [Armatimonadota bacterium]